MRRMSLDLESRWWTLGGAEVLDMMNSVGALVRAGQTVHIGTDAQKSATRMEFVTVACVLNPGKGGRVFYTRRFDRKEVTLFEKLSTETWLSLELAIRMHEAFDLSPAKQQIWVHVDANPDERFDSSDYVKQLARIHKETPGKVENNVRKMPSPDLRDVLTAIYYLRQNAAHINEPITTSIYSEGKEYPVVFRPVPERRTFTIEGKKINVVEDKTIELILSSDCGKTGVHQHRFVE